MMTSPIEVDSPAKPGTACLGCRRRKLKCSREADGCTNCSKASFPCVYPVADNTGIKRKRGPYKKDKAARERHLEDLVRYLEPGHARAVADGPAASANDQHETSNSIDSILNPARKASNSEDLVKDALVALTKSHVSETSTAAENGLSFLGLCPGDADAAGSHPTPQRSMEYWSIYRTRVDPVLKIVHCPSFEKTLFAVWNNPASIGPVTGALLFSIYHIAVSSCTAREAMRRFGEERSVLLARYGRIIESTLADNYSVPSIESLQALLTYITSIRRDDSLSNVRALYSLAVRMAQLIGVQNDPGDAYRPLEAEIRRRVWWHICGLESRGAEEGAARQSSILDGSEVRLPMNVNDVDLTPEMQHPPKPRTGVTECTNFLARCRVIRLVHRVMSVKRKYKNSGDQSDPAAVIKTEQWEVFEQGKKEFEEEFLEFLHPSRPLDWMCISWIQSVMIKIRMNILYPLGQVPTKDMTSSERLDLLQSSVDIIRLTNNFLHHKPVEPWMWFFRGWVQWHSIGIVIGELGHNKNRNFVNNAWAVLDPILGAWERVYQAKRDEPAWEHVNTLIERARGKRREMQEQGSTETAPPQALPPAHPVTIIPSVPPIPAMGPSNWCSSNIQVPTLADPPALPIQDPNYNLMATTMPSYNDMSLYSGFLPMPVPNAANMEMDFSYMDGFEGVDFSAFEGVFGDATWDYSSTSSEFPLMSG